MVRSQKELVTYEPLTFPTFSFFNRFFSLSRNCREEGCGKPYLKVKPVPVGGGLRVHTNCAAGHKLKWESCNFYNQVLLGGGLTSWEVSSLILWNFAAGGQMVYPSIYTCPLLATTITFYVVPPPPPQIDARHTTSNFYFFRDARRGSM